MRDRDRASIHVQKVQNEFCSGRMQGRMILGSRAGQMIFWTVAFLSQYPESVLAKSEVDCGHGEKRGRDGTLGTKRKGKKSVLGTLHSSLLPQVHAVVFQGKSCHYVHGKLVRYRAYMMSLKIPQQEAAKLII